MEHNPDYQDRFYAAAKRVLEAHGAVTTDAVVEEVGMPTGHASAIGASMLAFARANKLKVSNYVKGSRPASRSAIIAVWIKA